MPTLLPTTIAGSLPKPSWLAPPNQLWAPWLLEGEQLAEAKRDAVRLVVTDQEHAGIDIVSDGEQTRRHFVTTFIENLDGVDFEHKKTVRIRNRYDADVPMVVGPVARRGPVFVDDAAFLRSLTQRQVKYTLPGPMTMVDTLYDGHYRSREKLAWAFAEILNEEARAIAADRVSTSSSSTSPHSMSISTKSATGASPPWSARHRGSAAKPPCISVTATASRPTSTGRRRSGPSGANTSRPFRCSPSRPSIRCRWNAPTRHVPLDLLGLLRGKDVLVGAIDVATDRVESAGGCRGNPAGGATACSGGPPLPCTNCGMVPLTRAVARAKLEALGAGAALVRAELTR